MDEAQTRTFFGTKLWLLILVKEPKAQKATGQPLPEKDVQSGHWAIREPKQLCSGSGLEDGCELFTHKKTHTLIHTLTGTYHNPDSGQGMQPARLGTAK